MSFEELFRRRKRKPPAAVPKKRRRPAPGSLLFSSISRTVPDYFKRPHKRFIPKPLRPGKVKRVQNKALIPDHPPGLCATALVTESFRATARATETNTATALVTESCSAVTLVMVC